MGAAPASERENVTTLPESELFAYGIGQELGVQIPDAQDGCAVRAERLALCAVHGAGLFFAEHDAALCP